jgi:transposase
MPRGGSISPLENYSQRIFALIGEQPDLTLSEMVCVPRKHRVQISHSALSRFFARHDITIKKACKRQSASGPTGPGAVAVDTRARVGTATLLSAAFVG